MRDPDKAVVVVVVEPDSLSAWLLFEHASACGYDRRICHDRPRNPGRALTLHIFYSQMFQCAHVSLDHALFNPENQLVLTMRQALDYFSNDDLFIGFDIDCTILEDK